MAHVANVTIQSSQVSADLTDFVVYVDLSDLPTTEFWGTVANGGGDIRVYKSNGTTQLAREVVSCDTATDTGELHIKFTGTLSSSVDTVIQIHADGTSSEPAVTATYGRNAVWSDYNAVYHMSEHPALDSSGNGNDFTAENGAAAPTSFVLGDGLSFDGNDNYTFQPFNNAGAEVTEYEISFWAEYDYSTPGDPFSFRDEGLRARVFDNSGNILFQQQPSGSNPEVLHNNFSAATPYYYHWVYKKSTEYSLYVDGTFEDSDTTSLSLSKDRNDTTGFFVGSSYVSLSYFEGDMDELRFRKTITSSDWRATEYNNQNSPGTFYTVAAVSGGSSDVKTISGVAQANIKSMAGVSAANLKSIAGVSF